MKIDSPLITSGLPYLFGTNDQFGTAKRMEAVAVTLTLPDTTALAAYSGAVNTVVLATGDSYAYQSASTATAVGKYIIAATGKGGGRWFMQRKQKTVADFGATGDGSTNDSPAIQAAVDWAKFVNVPNGGNVRYEVDWLPGIYMLNTTINITNANGVWLRGSAGKYVNVQVVGNTGREIFDFTGSIMAGCEGFHFTTYATTPTPSTIAVQYALGENPDGTQTGGLNCGIRNCYFEMHDAPTLNAGQGTIGLLNIRSEEFFASDLLIKANSGMVFANARDLSQSGYAYTASSQFTPIIRGVGSMGNVYCYGCGIQNIHKRRPAIVLINANSFVYQGYLKKEGTTGNNETAVHLIGQSDNVTLNTTIEGFSQIAYTGTQCTNFTVDAVIANQIAPTIPVFDVTGTVLRRPRFSVSFTIPSEYNNGRVFLYHAPINGGDSAATGSINNGTFTCSDWIDNNVFISPNLLKRTANVDFNSGQPFTKVGSALTDRKTYAVPLGTTASGNPDIVGNAIRFHKPIKTTATSGNGGFYRAVLKGVVSAGSYTSTGRADTTIEATVLLTQNQDGTLNPQQGTTLILNESAPTPGVIALTSIEAGFDMSGGLGAVTLTVKSTGTGTGLPVTFQGVIELHNDHAVEQATIFA